MGAEGKGKGKGKGRREKKERRKEGEEGKRRERGRHKDMKQESFLAFQRLGECKNRHQKNDDKQMVKMNRWMDG